MSVHVFVCLLFWKPLLNYSQGSKFSVGFAMAEAVSRRILTVVDRVQSQGIPCGIYGEQSGSGTSFSPSISVSLSVSLHQCSILIHSSTTNAV